MLIRIEIDTSTGKFEPQFAASLMSVLLEAAQHICVAEMNKEEASEVILDMNDIQVGTVVVTDVDEGGEDA